MDRYKPNQPAEAERPSSSESSNSVLTANDWRKIERMLKEVVNDMHSKKVRKLNDTIQSLATSNILLEHKIKGYERALQNEKKKRQRAKPLFHQLATQQDGHATFFSPKKVQEARDLQKEQQDAKDREAALKANKKIQRQLQKEEKRRLIDQRKAQRIQDKEAREREAAARKVATQQAKEAKQAKQQLQSSLNQARKSKRDKNNGILAIEEVDLEATSGAEVQVVEIADRRPIRQKRLPPRLKDYEIELA